MYSGNGKAPATEVAGAVSAIERTGKLESGDERKGVRVQAVR